MKNRLTMCATYLEEVELKLSELANSVEDGADRARASEALSFVQLAKKAISETESRVGSLHVRTEIDKATPAN
jgi:hypothetical protein